MIDKSYAPGANFELQCAKFTAVGKLEFDSSADFDQALLDGFFLVSVPDIDLTAGDVFAQNFYKPKDNSGSDIDIYRGFNKYTPDKFDARHEGYYLREVDQAEQFFLEKKYWEELYPTDLTVLANEMDQLALDILKNVLRYVGVPESLWEVATGECSRGEGTHHLTFNHFRPEKKARGLNIHKDSGWVTVLRSIEPGLEAYIGGKWRKILPREGFFIVNFGCAMEILTAKLEKKVAAVVHRVVQQPLVSCNHPDRFSYALFTDNSLDEAICKGLYEYSRDAGLILKMNFRKFLDDILHATYEEDSVGLY